MQDTIGIKFDKNTFAYKRLLVHLSYAYERVKLNLQIDEDITEYMKTKYGSLFDIVREVADYLEKEYKLEISDGEVSYLVMHIGRYVKETD